MHTMNTNQRLYSVRGAVCCENTQESIIKFVPKLFQEIIQKNSIIEESIVSIIFSVTGDLTVMNPATALRNAGFSRETSLFSCLEPYIEGYLPSVIRILITYYGINKPEAVYINGAEVLRPDLLKDFQEKNQKL